MKRSVEECSRDLTGTEQCANEGCVRPVERGERWCPTCGLDRALFRREARRPAPAAPEAPSAREAGRR
jgi:predicted amidophosphoribosyltransferase